MSIAQPSQQELPAPSPWLWVLYIILSLACFPIGIILAILAFMKPGKSYKPIAITTLCVSVLQLFVAFAAMLAAIMVPNFIRARAQSQLSVCKGNLKNIATALELWATDNDGAYPENLQQLVPTYLRSVPQCPTTQRNTYTYQVTGHDKLDRPNSYEVFCEGEWHIHITRAPNYPRYTSQEGLTITPQKE